MKWKNILIGGVVLALGALAVFAYVVRPSAEASAPIEAISISDPLPTNDAGISDDEAVEEPVEEPVEESISDDNSTELNVFTIDQNASQVRFSIDELLNGVPTTAVGVTDQVAGEIGIDFENPANIVLGTIQVNARTIETDKQNRNRAIANQILDTGEFEFITFEPKELIGLPLVIEFGMPYEIQVIGELTIRDFTNAETWDMVITVVSENEIVGTGSSTVIREAYDLNIPEVRSVANVTQEVLLFIDFVATR